VKRYLSDVLKTIKRLRNQK